MTSSEPVPGEPFQMSIQDTFIIKNRGLVLTGKIQSGRLQGGDAVELAGFGLRLPATVLDLVMFGRKNVKTVSAGDQVGVLLQGVEKSQVRAGMVLQSPTPEPTETRAAGMGCPSCGSVNALSQSHCILCGASLKPSP